MVTQTAINNGRKQQIQITKMLPVVKGKSQLAIEFDESERKLTLANVAAYLQNVNFERIIETIQGE